MNQRSGESEVFPHLRFFSNSSTSGDWSWWIIESNSLIKSTDPENQWKSGEAVQPFQTFSNMLHATEKSLLLDFWASQSWHLLFPSRKPRDWSIRKWDRFHGSTTRGSMASRWEKPLKRGMLPLATAEPWQTGLNGHSETCLMESRFSPRTCKIFLDRAEKTPSSSVLWERMWNNYEGLKVFVNAEPLCSSTWMNTTTTRLWHKTLGWSMMWW